MAIRDSGIAAIRTELGEAAQNIEIDMIQTIILAGLHHATDLDVSDFTKAMDDGYPQLSMSTVATVLAYMFADDKGLGIGDVYTICSFDSRIDKLMQIKKHAPTLYFSAADSHAMLATLDFVAVLKED